jgi:hypothetical protein
MFMFSSVSCNHFVVLFHIMFIGIFHGVYIGLTAILYVLVMQWGKKKFNFSKNVNPNIEHNFTVIYTNSNF